MKKCVYCEKEFEPNSNRQRYCSKCSKLVKKANHLWLMRQKRRIPMLESTVRKRGNMAKSERLEGGWCHNKWQPGTGKLRVKTKREMVLDNNTTPELNLTSLAARREYARRTKILDAIKCGEYQSPEYLKYCEPEVYARIIRKKELFDASADKKTLDTLLGKPKYWFQKAEELFDMELKEKFIAKYIKEHS